MSSGIPPMPPEQVAELLEDAEAVDRAAEAQQAMLRAAAEDARDAAEARIEAAGEDEPSLVERIMDLLDRDADEPDEAPAEA